ncbi:hypothetical protein QZH41_007019 [Actinostola sp. cb2023]|nr:hypothetical protein QZH41_007019 [Actinostola sp. cb2023]
MYPVYTGGTIDDITRQISELDTSLHDGNLQTQLVIDKYLKEKGLQFEEEDEEFGYGKLMIDYKPPKPMSKGKITDKDQIQKVSGVTVIVQDVRVCHTGVRPVPQLWDTWKLDKLEPLDMRKDEKIKKDASKVTLTDEYLNREASMSKGIQKPLPMIGQPSSVGNRRDSRRKSYAMKYLSRLHEDDLRKRTVFAKKHKLGYQDYISTAHGTAGTRQGHGTVTVRNRRHLEQNSYDCGKARLTARQGHGTVTVRNRRHLEQISYDCGKARLTARQGHGRDTARNRRHLEQISYDCGKARLTARQGHGTARSRHGFIRNPKSSRPRHGTSVSPSGKNISPFLVPRSPGDSKAFKVGDRVHLRGYVGTIKFVGATELGQGDWIGMEMDKEMEQGHNGNYDGIQYFICGPKRGVFARSTLVFHLDESNEKTLRGPLPISPRTVVLIQTMIRRYLKRIHQKKTQLTSDVDKTIDKYVRSVPESEITSINRLSHYLTEPFDGGQRSKAFAIYRWITLNVAFDYKGYFGKESLMDCAAENVLKNRVAVSEGYSSLFEALCRAANVPARTVHGIFKGYGYKLGEAILNGQCRHSWNVIRVAGEWYICDCTLGAGYVGEDMMFHKMSNIERFMVQPELALTDHFPDEEKWQLLDATVSKEDFEAMAVPSATMYRLRVRLDSHKNCCYDIDADSIVMSFQSPKKNILKGIVKDSNGRSLGQRSLVQMVSQGDKTKLQAYFPEPGEYILQICVLGTHNEWIPGVVYKIHTWDGIGYNTGGFPSIGTKFYSLGFQIEKPSQNLESDDGRAVLYISCSNNKIRTLKPKLSRLSIVCGTEDLHEDVQDTSMCYVDKGGVTFKVKVHVPQMGIYKLDLYCELRKQTEYLCSYFINAFHGATPVAGFPKVTDVFRYWTMQLVDKRENIEAQDGKTSITLRNPKGLVLIGALLKDEEECPGMCCTDSNQKKGESTVRVHTPEPGIFRLDIYGRQEGEKNKHLLCSYVIKSLETASENPGFPLTTETFKSWGVALVEPTENITSKNGSAIVVLQAPEDVEILGKLFDEDGKNVPGMCIAKETENGREISMNTPRPGAFKLSVYGRRGKKAKKVLLCSYKIKSHNAASENPGFPELTETFSAWNLKLVDQFDNISTDTGRAVVTINTPRSILLSARLRQNEKNLSSDLCFAERHGSDTKISIHVPEAGLYQLNISGRESPGAKSEFLGSYSVFSCRGLGERAGFPRLEDEFRLWGLRLDSNRENIAVYDGSVVITFLNPNMIELHAELLDGKESVPSVIEDQMEERMVYRCTLPKKGKYTFKLLGTNVAGSGDQKLLCLYKIFY